MAVRKRNKLVYGVGINDADYEVMRFEMVGIKFSMIWKCPIYRVWSHMLGRCYSPVEQKNNPTYLGCSVVTEWHLFSAFRKWMIDQSWGLMAIDKDILYLGNKVYGPDFCIFVTQALNTFLTDCARSRGSWPIGVSLKKKNNKFQAQCQNPFTRNREHLGYFSCPLKAHEAWRQRKHRHACRYADMQTDQRIAKALRDKYSACKDNY